MSRFVDRFWIGDRMVGGDAPCFVIAEAGVSHFGSLDKAFRLVDMSVTAGADAVKFQIFDVNAMIAEVSSDWRKRMSSRQLPYEDFRRIRDYCQERGILFMATAHDEPSLDYLATLDVPAYKIGSGELSNWDFLAKTARLGKPLIFSTGMYTEADIASALGAVAKTGNREVAVLHCVTRYPTPPEEVNLRAMLTIRDRFDVVAGYSDHTAGRHIPLASVALGAQILEKHITLEFDIPNAQDWKVSCGPEDLPLLVQELRDIEKSLGHGRKEPVAGELASRDWARKSLVAADTIPAGTELTAELLSAKRPGTGIPPSEIEKVLGRHTCQEVERGTLITWDQLS